MRCLRPLESRSETLDATRLKPVGGEQSSRSFTALVSTQHTNAAALLPHAALSHFQHPLSYQPCARRASARFVQHSTSSRFIALMHNLRTCLTRPFQPKSCFTLLFRKGRLSRNTNLKRRLVKRTPRACRRANSLRKRL